MGRHKKQLTQEQIDFRNGILRRRLSGITKAQQPAQVITDEDKIRQSFYYLDNCIFWINEYVDGRVDKDKLMYTAKAIQENARKLEITLINLKQKTHKENQ